MQQAQILSILLDMALAIGGEDRLEPLLLNALQRFMHHTAFPCGLILLREASEPDASLKLALSIGDHQLAAHHGKTLQIEPALMEANAALITDTAAIDRLPGRTGWYRAALMLPVPRHGVVLLLTPSPPSGKVPFAEMFKPVLSNFAKAIDLCRVKEAYMRELINDRDEARAGLVRFRSALDTSSDYIFLIEAEALRFVDFNRSVVEDLGYSCEGLLAMGPNDITPGHSLEEWRRRLRPLTGGRRDDESFEGVLRRRNGGEFPAEIRLSMLRTGGEGPLVIAIARDITERKLGEAELFEERERALVTLHSIGDGVITTDAAGRIDYLNPTAEELTGWRRDDALGHPVAEVFRIINEQTREPVDNPAQRVLAHGKVVGLANHTVLIDRDGVEHPIEDSAAPIRNSEGEVIGVVMVFHDVTRTRDMARQLSWQASHDSLTGLYNRREFESRLSHALASAREENRQHILLYLDLDQFKLVNDTSGHIAGDELLRGLSVVLSSYVREGDLLARLGGDEFGLLLENCLPERALQIADDLRRAVVGFRFVWGNKTFEVGVSIGVAIIDSQSESATALLSAADLACYAAKELGRNRVHVYRPDDVELARREGEMHVVADISRALEEDRFELYAQVIEPLTADGVVHFEVLLRMLGPEDDLLSPAAFIPAAERFNLMPAVDRWVVCAVLRTLARFETDRSTVFAINLSGTSLADDELPEFITGQLVRYGVPPERICFEITETAAISNLGKASKVIRTLTGLGCRFALDDFGTGLSSFGYLKALPVDYLKIGGGFVRNMLDDPLDAAVVESVTQIGHVLDKKIIAEFVENDAIRDRLAAIGVDYAQGIRIGRPQPLVSLLGSKEPAGVVDMSGAK